MASDRNEREAMSNRTTVARRVTPLSRLGGSCVALIVSLSLPAHAQAPAACSDPRIAIEGPLEPAWARAVLELCDSLGSLPDLDPKIVIRVISSHPQVILEASLPDGRTALRRVHAPADLRSTLEALATVPPPPPPPPPVPTPPVAPAPPAPPAPPVLAPRRPEALGLELGFSADARVEGGRAAYVSGGPAAYVALRPGPWLVALQLRWQVAQTVVHDRPRDFEMSTIGFGFVVARRFALAPAVHLDVGASTSLLVQSQEYKPHGGGEDDEIGVSAVDVRFGPIARAIFGRGEWRGLFSLDADLSPVRLRRSERLDPGTPYFPTYGIGLNAGVCWGAAEP